MSSMLHTVHPSTSRQRCHANSNVSMPSGVKLRSSSNGPFLKLLGHLVASLIPRVWTRSEAVDGNHRLVFGRGLEDVAVIMGPHELTPVRRWVAGR